MLWVPCEEDLNHKNGRMHIPVLIDVGFNTNIWNRQSRGLVFPSDAVITFYHNDRFRDLKAGKQQEVLWVFPCKGETTCQDFHARASFYEWIFFFSLAPLFLFCEWKTTGKASRKSPQSVHIWLAAGVTAPPIVARSPWISYLIGSLREQTSFRSRWIQLDKSKKSEPLRGNPPITDVQWSRPEKASPTKI